LHVAGCSFGFVIIFPSPRLLRNTTVLILSFLLSFSSLRLCRRELRHETRDAKRVQNRRIYTPASSPDWRAGATGLGRQRTSHTATTIRGQSTTKAVTIHIRHLPRSNRLLHCISLQTMQVYTHLNRQHAGRLFAQTETLGDRCESSRDHAASSVHAQSELSLGLAEGDLPVVSAPPTSVQMGLRCPSCLNVICVQAAEVVRARAGNTYMSNYRGCIGCMNFYWRVRPAISRARRLRPVSPSLCLCLIKALHRPA
jgi:hypothetical protein